MILAIGLHALTIVCFQQRVQAASSQGPMLIDRQAIFLYLVLYLPWVRGYMPNVRIS